MFHSKHPRITDIKIYASTENSPKPGFNLADYVRELLREIEQRDDIIKHLQQELDARKEDTIIHNNQELLTTVNHIVRIPEKVFMYFDKIPGTEKTVLLCRTTFSDGSKSIDKLFEYGAKE